MLSKKDLDEFISTHKSKDNKENTTGNNLNEQFLEAHTLSSNPEVMTQATNKKIKEKKRKETPDEGWDMSFFQFPCCILSLGKSKSGKSYNTSYLLNYFTIEEPVFHGGIVMLGSQGLNEDYDFLPKKCIINGYQEEILQNYVAKLKKYRETHNKPPPASFLVLDDLMGQLNNSQWFQNFISTYRHYNITVFLNVQFLKSRASSTLLREQVSYAFIFNTKTKNTIDALYDCFGQLFNSYEEFKQHFLQTSKERYSCMLYIADRDELEHNYYKYMGPINFKPKKISFK